MTKLWATHAIQKFLNFCLLLSSQVVSNCEKTKEPKNLKHLVNRHIRSLDFPPASGMGIFFAMAVPLDIPDKSISLSYYFEANYGVPIFNDSLPSYYGTEDLKKRSIDRRLVYHVIQSKLEKNGYPGKACLMRAICESAEFPFEQSGLVGDIVRIILTPSSSLREALPLEVVEAEYATSCSKYQEACPLSFLDLISYDYK